MFLGFYVISYSKTGYSHEKDTTGNYAHRCYHYARRRDAMSSKKAKKVATKRQKRNKLIIFFRKVFYNIFLLVSALILSGEIEKIVPSEMFFHNGFKVDGL